MDVTKINEKIAEYERNLALVKETVKKRTDIAEALEKMEKMLEFKPESSHLVVQVMVPGTSGYVRVMAEDVVTTEMILFTRQQLNNKLEELDGVLKSLI